MGDFYYSPSNGTKVELNTPTTFTVEYTKWPEYGCSITLMLMSSSGAILRMETHTSDGSDTHFYNTVASTFGEYVSNDGAPSYLTFSGYFWPPGNPDYLIRLTDVPKYPIVRYEQCNAPTSITVSSSTVAPGASVKLSWKGAYWGIDSGISAYKVYRATSVDGTYSLLTTISSTSASGSTTVVAPTTENATYYYKVQTISATSGKDSDMSTAYASLTAKYTAVTAPNSVTVDPTNAEPNGEAQLSWKNAAAGTGNAITAYEVYRASTLNAADEDYELLDTVTTSATSGSLTVYAPGNPGDAYYYRIKVIGTLADLDSGLSAAYASLACTYSVPGAPNKVTLNGETSLYVLPDDELLLEWSGASDGANNPIVGYRIYRDGEVYADNLAPTESSYPVEPNSDPNGNYTYTVQTIGKHEDSEESTPCVVYTYTHPTPPTEFTLSDDAPPIGSRVTLSWSGAEAGGHNNITGYSVYRAEEVNGNYTLIENVDSTDTTASCLVDAHPLVSFSYYFRVETLGTRSGSGMSEAYATLTSGETTAPDSDVTVVITPKPQRTKRKMVFGDYDTDADGQWTLCEWTFTEPETQTNFVEVPGRAAGPIDMSTALTGGDPRYGSRELEARFECSEGTRLERNEIISDMVNRLHGQRVNIELPDDPMRYVTGRLAVQKEYSDMAHASVLVTGVCDPWRYSKQYAQTDVLAVEAVREIVLCNSGRRIVAPEVTVTGVSAMIYLTLDSGLLELTEGTYHIPGFTLKPGNNYVKVNGKGTVTFKYREAIL